MNLAATKGRTAGANYTSKQERGLKTERDRFVGFAFASAELLIEIDKKGRILYIAGALSRLQSEKNQVLVGHQLRDFFATADLSFFDEVVAAAFANERVEPITIRFASATTDFSARMGICVLPNAKDRAYLSFSSAFPSSGTTADFNDPDYSIADNRKKFEKTAQQRMKESKESGIDMNLSTIVIEGLSQLKNSKDRDAAEEFLNKLSAMLRVQSVGGDGGTILADGRIGVVTHGDVSADQMTEKIENLAKESNIEGVGVKTFSMEFDAGELSDADAARALLYTIRQAASSNTNDLTLGSLTDSAQKLIDESLERIDGLRSAISDEAFELTFQPVVKTSDNEIDHFEVFTRLTGTGPNSDLADFAEETGMIEDLDLVVAKMALEDLKAQASDGWNPDVVINVSSETIQSDLFSIALQRVAGEAGDVASQLSVEVSDASRITDFWAANDSLQTIRRAGLKVGLDGIGQGPTTFDCLRQLDVDFVKLDGTLIKHAISDRISLTMVKSILDLCKHQDNQVIAQGIEDENQLTLIKRLGIELAQGPQYGEAVTNYRETYEDGVDINWRAVKKIDKKQLRKSW